MDSLELLNVLDVIKNEEVYKARLEQLKKAQSKLDTSQHIVATVEKATSIMEAARLDKDKAAALVAKLEHDLGKVRVEVERAYEDKLAAIKEREKKVHKIQEDSRVALHQAHDLKVKLEEERNTLQEWDAYLAKKEADVYQVEQKQNSKFARIKLIIEE